jgi:hypothetical protein
MVLSWDKSEAFKGGVTASIWRNVDDVPLPQRNALMVRAMREPSLRGIYLDTLLRCADVASAWLEGEVRRASTQVRDAALADSNAPFSIDEFDAEVERLLDFARERSDRVRDDVRRSPR